MKKLLILNSSLSIVGPLFASCNQHQQVKISSNSNLKYTIKNSIQPIADYLFSDNSEEKEDYFLNQDSYSKSKFNEFGYSLRWFAPFYKKTIKKNTIYVNASEKSRDIIQNTLTNDWYWYLNNIDKFIFVLNPFGDEYEFTPDKEALFEKFNNLNKDLYINVKNKKIKDILNLNLNIGNETNEYQDKKIVYITYEDNLVINAFLYTDNSGIKKMQLTGDLFEFDKTLSNEECKAQIIKLNRLMIKEFEKLSNYWIQYGKEKYNQNWESDFGDKAFFDFWTHNDTYLEAIKNAINSIKKQSININRYSIGEIDNG